MEQVLGVQFGHRYESSGAGYVILQQAPYEPGVGYTTKIDLVKALGDALYSGGENSIDCGLEDDWSMETYMYAYPSSKTLSFFVGCTHGVVSGGVHESVEVREVVSFKLTASATVRYPVTTILSREWVNDVYDGEGNRVSAPTLTIDDRTILASKETYSQVILTYRTFRRKYRVRITPREDSVENVYQSVFYAVFSGGVSMEKIDPPPGAEEDYASGATCGWRTIVNINPDDDKPTAPTLGQEDKEVEIDYCSQTENK